MARTVIDQNRIPEFSRALQASLAGLLNDVGDEALAAIDTAFEQERTPAGEPWAPLAGSTVAAKGDSTILQDTGDLRESFGTQVTWSPTGEKRLTIYSTDEKLRFHEFGTETMPARPIMVPLARHLSRNALDTELTQAVETAERAAGIL